MLFDLRSNRYRYQETSQEMAVLQRSGHQHMPVTEKGLPVPRSPEPILLERGKHCQVIAVLKIKIDGKYSLSAFVLLCCIYVTFFLPTHSLHTKPDSSALTSAFFREHVFRRISARLPPTPPPQNETNFQHTLPTTETRYF
jgi:hypothetical protein